MKRIILYTEGKGDVYAAPRLVKKLLTVDDFEVAFVDDNVFRVGDVNDVLKDDCRDWKRLLRAGLKRRNVGGAILILDGDTKWRRAQQFCAMEVAQTIARESVSVGAGATFSAAVVLIRQEFETLFLAGFDSLRGQRLPDGRIIAQDYACPAGNLELSPRDAKGCIRSAIAGGYKPTLDQAAVTGLLNINSVRQQNLRSFRRLESALSELMNAIRTGTHVATPN